MHNILHTSKCKESKLGEGAQVPPSDLYVTITGGHCLGARGALVPPSYNVKISFVTAYNKTTFNTRDKIHFALRARNILTNFRHSQARGENDFPYSQGRRENC